MQSAAIALHCGCRCTPTAGSLVRRFLSTVPRAGLVFKYARSSGPGGQHVNKVNTKVDCRFTVRNAAWLTEEEREGLGTKHGNKMNAHGELVVTSQASRSQAENVNDCIRKVQELVDSLEANYGTRKDPRRRWTTRQTRQARASSSDASGSKHSKPIRAGKKGKRMWVWDHPEAL